MDNNMTFLNACRNGQKSIVQIFLKKGGIDVNNGMRRVILRCIMRA